MTILITGASGFVGRILAQHIHTIYPDTPLLLIDIETPLSPSPTPCDHIKCLSTDLTDPTSTSDLIKTHAPTLRTVYILHGIMSSASESNLSLGLSVNLDSIRHLLDSLHTHTPGIKVIFTSSCAVYGRSAVTNTATEATITPFPESSYGTQKLMIEYLLNDYSRRGLLDGRIVRLPTIFVRSGKPTAAASSFVSGIVREPVHGVESEVPVDPEIGIWLASPRCLARNLVHAMEVEKVRFGSHRTVLLPGFTACSREILECLEKVAGREVRERVREKRDEGIERIVRSWPARYDTSRAKELGFYEDEGLEAAIREFVKGAKGEV
ncbi:NAD(P)-binding protein [Sporormia fimetaria CBS 119925]|uniref:NAD(P)-binding protein n=1 Tax=Sporormia fimetaria CBS 119925 TaxID=1340428 RepID=A0A6A6VDA8_9PLEO|nr:NAD(P)-binding protein [Sporormia fimetaria CBS 119925]